ncbi:MAG: hypothetical protein K0R24_626 [Gammaproteobacteria bacterium]|jgi:type I restriction enzyme S subunit|nr:hypothetical protein [Gammaproteobacteria bacterium]
MSNIEKLGNYIKKKSIRAESTADYNDMPVLGVSNKLGITKTDHKKSKDLSNYLIIESGDFAYNPYRINVGSIGLVHQAVGLVSPAYVVFTTTDKLIPELLLDFLKSTEGLFQIGKYARGTVRKALRFEDLCEIEIPIPSIDEQRQIIKRKSTIEVELDSLKSGINYQLILLNKLKQQILQDAIEGKLTKKWRIATPDIESASKLLKRISDEKEQLIKNGKIKKQEPLPKITDEDKPFILPKGWEWCHFGAYASFARGRFSIRPRNDQSCFGGKHPFIQIGSLDDKGSVVNTYSQTLNDKGFAASKMFEKGTIMVAIVGGTIGNLGVLGRDMCFPDSIVGVKPSNTTCQDYILLLLRHFQPLLRKLSYQMAGQPNIKLPTLNNLICGLPPFEEQQVIVTKVNELFAICDQLEAKITQNQIYADQLMQAVLKEAFTQTAGTPQTNDNVVEFKAKYTQEGNNQCILLGAEIVSRLHKEPTLGHKKFQKVFYLCQKTQNLSLPTNFKQHAAGPYDYDLARTIDSALQANDWFVFRENSRLKYKQLPKAGSHKTDFQECFKNDLAGINRIIALFKSKSSDEAEAVATLYACWEEILKSDRHFSKGRLIEKFYNWSPEKRKFSENQLNQVIAWMEKQDIYPKVESC